jgi:redox-sensing transcriptional repressor
MLIMDPARPRPTSDAVSESTTARLSMYLRALDALERDGVDTVSSGTLAERCHLNAALIRKDLAYFGEFGVRGVGYVVQDLRRHVKQILGLDRRQKVVIVGAGNLGLALADYSGFEHEGFDIVALFDVAPLKVGIRSRGGVEVRHLDDLPVVVEVEQVDIAVVAVPRDAAQEVVTAIVRAGIRAILNFAPGAIRAPDGVKIKNMDLSVSLETLSFHLAQGAHASTAS